MPKIATRADEPQWQIQFLDTCLYASTYRYPNSNRQTVAAQLILVKPEMIQQIRVEFVPSGDHLETQITSVCIVRNQLNRSFCRYIQIGLSGEGDNHHDKLPGRTGDHRAFRIAGWTAKWPLIVGKDWQICDVDQILSNALVRFP